MRLLKTVRSHRSGTCKTSVIFLAVLWTCGLTLGFIFAYFTSADANIYVVELLAQPISALGISVRILPILLMSMLLMINKRCFLLVFIFFYSLCSGISMCLITTTFHSAAWLIYLLTCFSGIFSQTAVLWLAIRIFSSRKYSYKKEVRVAVITAVLIGIIDHAYISPFLISLFEQR